MVNLHISCPYVVGGGSPDEIFIDSNHRFISRYILKYVFGNYLIIEEKEEMQPFNTGDNNIVSFNYNYNLYLQNFPNNIEEIKQRILGQNKVMRLK